VTFIESYLNEDLNNHKIDTTIKIAYFIFTTLSTVGFGDMSPQAPHERLLGAFLLMFGVAIFSMFMSIFSEIL
jgi:hypothetical protein